ncbi:hypothetical protein GCM10023317_44680 [Actinopolymorpha pittospori]
MTGCSVHPDAPGCSDQDKRLAPRLNDVPELQLHPHGTTLHDQYAGCDQDDGFAHAGRTYRRIEDIDAATAYYRAAATTAGWKLERADDAPVPPEGLVISGARLCFTRTHEGTTSYLAVWFPSDFGDKSADVGVELTASHDGEAGC